MNSQQDIEMDQTTQLFSNLSLTIREGGTVKDLIGLTNDECEALYTMGHNFYEQGLYSKAFKVFSILVTYDHLNDKYFMALAGASQMLQLYDIALHNYTTVAIMRLDDPAPIFHSAECLIALSHMDEAAEALELILAMPNATDENSYNLRARALLSTLKDRAAPCD